MTKKDIVDQIYSKTGVEKVVIMAGGYVRQFFSAVCSRWWRVLCRSHCPPFQRYPRCFFFGGGNNVGRGMRTLQREGVLSPATKDDQQAGQSAAQSAGVRQIVLVVYHT